MSPKPAASPTDDPWLLTPGPLTTSPTVKQAMCRDYGSRDGDFIEINRRVRERLVDIVGARSTHVCVPLQGSGTFVVEAMLGCFVPRDGKLLILVNGAYGKRMARMCEYLNRSYSVLETPEDTPCDPDALDKTLTTDSAITHVAAIQCETTSGILNPIEALAEVSARHQRGFLIDAMSAFGAIGMDARSVPFDALVASSNKCLEGVPGMGFCIARRQALEKTAGNSASLSLDLHDQWVAMEKNGQWHFCHIHLYRVGPKAIIGCPSGQVGHPPAGHHRLRRRAPHIDAGAAHVLPLDDGCLPPGSAHSERERLAGLAGTDHNGVVALCALCCLCHEFLTSFRLRNLLFQFAL